jgi:ribosomal protein S18 acetylase RimI-like enzyme
VTDLGDDLVVDSLPAPVASAMPLSPTQVLELAALNVMLVAGDGVLRVAWSCGRSVGRSLVFGRITADVERVVLSGSQPGFVAHLRATDSALLTDLMVVEDARRRGVGTRLVEDALEVARRLGRRRLTLEVRRDNEPALRIYRRLAFELEGEGDIVWCSRAI